MGGPRRTRTVVMLTRTQAAVLLSRASSRGDQRGPRDPDRGAPSASDDGVPPGSAATLDNATAIHVDTVIERAGTMKADRWTEFCAGMVVGMKENALATPTTSPYAPRPIALHGLNRSKEGRNGGAAKDWQPLTSTDTHSAVIVLSPQNKSGGRVQRVRLYIDESETRRNERGDSWLYICTVAVTERAHPGVLEGLLDDRRLTRCQSELHFKKTKSADKVALATRWLNRVLGSERLYFHILGIHLNRLEHGFFGPAGADRDQRIYTRFFRPAITYPLKAFFGSPVEISAVFHDGGKLEHHEWFDWHSLWRIQREHPDVKFSADRVQFIDSDHRKEPAFPKDSHLIQLADLILGASRVCLDGGCDNQRKRAVAEQMIPLLQRMMSGKRNINSSFKYVDRKSISFFPSKQIKLGTAADDAERLRSGFYRSREFLILRDQLSLFSA